MTDAFAHPRHLRAYDRSPAAQPAGAAPARARPGAGPDRGAGPSGAAPRPGAGLIAAGLTDDAPLHEARGLTSGGSLARIRLDGQVYTLRITRQGKLILTK